MSVHRPAGLHAGFHATANPHEAAGLIHAGEQWAPGTFTIDRHAHAGWELYLQVHGTTRWSVATEQRRLAPGDLLAVAPGVEHALAERSAANHHFYYAAFELEPILARHPALATAWPRPAAAAHVAGGERLLPAFQALTRELAVRLAFPAAGLQAALDVLAVEAARTLAAPHAGARLAIHPAVSVTRDLLDAQYDRPWPLAELSARVGLSPGHLHHLFTRHVGVTPHRYQHTRRMRRAQELLAGTDLETSRKDRHP